MRKNIRILVAMTALLVTLVPADTASAVNPFQPRVVSADPADFTPNVLDGIVNAIVPMGDSIVVGGQFTQVSEPGGPVLSRTNIFAFDADTGAINPTFAPTLDGSVLALATDGVNVFVGGTFATVNGVNTRRLEALDPDTGLAVESWLGRINSGSGVYDMLVKNGTLYIGGAFSQVNGQARQRLAALSAATGVLDPNVNVAFAGQHNLGSTRVHKLDITPDGTRLVAIGNFRTVDGLDREQIAILDLTSSPVTVDDWQTDRFKPLCASRFDTYMRDVDVSPDGSYFVVGTTGAYMGGPAAGVLCDTVTRWDATETGSALQPEWIDYTGGDTTFSVAATGTAVYVGGHQRWWNNPFAGDAQGPGAVSRPGIAALDPLNGIPFRWNPVRKPRGLGVQSLVATDAGLWVGSDTDVIADELHQKLAFMPLPGGSAVPLHVAHTLPNDLYMLPRSGCLLSDPSILYRVNAGGSQVAALDCGPDWAVDTSGSPSPLHNTGSVTELGTGVTPNASVPATTPTAVFNDDRQDPAGGNEMAWSFPVASGRTVKVRLYFANLCGCTKQVGRRRFDVAIDGSVVLPNYDIVADAGNKIGVMKEFIRASDGSVDISFTHIARDPQINAIEIIDSSFAPPGGSTEFLAHRPFDGADAGSASALSTPDVDWSRARGAFFTNGKIYTGWDDGHFYSRTFDGLSVGPAADIDLRGLTGSHWPLQSITGMFFTNGRIYYTVDGDARMFYRYFTPESDVVGAQTFVASGVGDGLNWSLAAGMALADGRIYFSRDDGNLFGIDFANGSPVPGTENLVDGTGNGQTWLTRGMFVWGTSSDNVAPSTPGTPSGTSSSVGTIDLTWAASSDNSSASLTYDVYRDGDGTPVGSVVSSSTGTVDFTDTGLAAGSTHTYAVTATDEAGNPSGHSPASDPIVVQNPDMTPPTVPGQPIGTADGTSRIDLTWAASSDNASASLTYDVYRDGDGTPVGSVVSSSTGTVDFTDTGLAVGSTHTYTVTATDEAGNPSGHSPASDPIMTDDVFFADAFDGGDFTNWTRVTNLTIDGGIGGVAPPSALGSVISQNAWAAKDLPATYAAVCMSEAVNLTSQGANALDLLRLRTAGNGGIIKAFLTGTGRLALTSDVTGTSRFSGIALPGGWNTVELCGTVGTAGSWDLYLNGVKIVDAWVVDTGTTPVGRVQIGDNLAKTFTINFDDVVVDGSAG